MRFGSGNGYSDWKLKLAITLGAGLPGTGALAQQVPIIGETYAHDPSPVLDDNSTYFYYSTGQDILTRESTDLSHWSDGPAIFSAQPAWTTTDVPGFTGDFWAPSVNYFSGLYHMYYAVSTFGSQVSGIGLATSPTLKPGDSNYAWTDHGPVIESKAGYAYNTIDPSVITANDGTMWMSFGSYWTGIYEEQLNPTTGMLLNPGTAPIHLSQRAGSDTSDEASYLYYRNGFYYLFENWGSCCDGVSSTYNVRMGRSTSVNGPFVDASGTGLLAGGGTNFLSAQGQYIGPGQVGIYSQSGQDYVSYHYYNGSNSGTPAFALQDLYWTADGWPSTTEPLTWSASTTGGTPVDGGGTWDLSHTNFIYNASNQIWNSSGYGGVTFGSAGGAAGTVTLSQNVSLQTITFNAASSGNYTIAGNGHTITIATGNNAGIITVNANATITAAIRAGSLTRLGTAVLTLTGATTATNFFPRQGTTIFSGTGSLTTATSPVSTADDYSSIGQVPGDNATVTLMNNATLTIAGDFNIGDVGAAGSSLNGTLNVQNSATVNARDLFVGKYVNAHGTVNQSGGIVQQVNNGLASGDWQIGGSGSSADAAAVGIYNLSGGTFTTGTNFQVGTYGNGTFTQTGGSATVGGYLSIGRYPGGVGADDLSSGNGTLNASGAPWMIVGEQGTGTLKIGGTSVVTATGLSIGHNNGGTGTVIQTGGAINIGANGLEFGTVAAGTGSAASGSFTLTGGLLATPSITRNQQSTVTGTFNFNGGTLEPTTNNAMLIPAGLTNAYVQAGGADINTNGNTATIAQMLAHDPALGSTADGGLTKAGTGTLIVNGIDSYTGPTTVTAGTLDFGANPGTGIELRNTGTVTIAASAKLALTANAVHTNRTLLVTPGLSIAGSIGAWSGTLDLGDNDLDVHNGNLAQITSQIKTGFAAGPSNWTGPGITSSTAAADTTHLIAVGVVLNNNGQGSPIYGSSAALGLFDGTSPAVTDVLVKETYFGDANLDGHVDGSDYTEIDNGFNNHLTGWANGDFNYDGVVNGSDYTLIDNAFNTQAAPLAALSTNLIAITTSQIAGATPVPEPALLGLVTLGGVLIPRRRRPLGRNNSV
jgi:autotransporter-associated beta strand protein